MKHCNWVDNSIGEVYGVGCTTCGRKFNSFMTSAEILNKQQLMCSNYDIKVKIYLARPINLYNTPQDLRDINLLTKLGFEILNPNKEKLQERYRKEGMDVFFEAMKECTALAYRSFLDGKISAGVKKEIDKAIEMDKPIIELPTITSGRILSVEDTREYLKLLGYR